MQHHLPTLTSYSKSVLVWWGHIRYQIGKSIWEGFATNMFIKLTTGLEKERQVAHFTDDANSLQCREWLLSPGSHINLENRNRNQTCDLEYSPWKGLEQPTLPPCPPYTLKGTVTGDYCCPACFFRQRYQNEVWKDTWVAPEKTSRIGWESEHCWQYLAFRLPWVHAWLMISGLACQRREVPADSDPERWLLLWVSDFSDMTISSSGLQPWPVPWLSKLS